MSIPQIPKNIFTSFKDYAFDLSRYLFGLTFQGLDGWKQIFRNDHPGK